jgi:thiol:disulfide interchange protein
MATSSGPVPSPVTAPEPSTGKPSLNPRFLVQALGFGIAGIFNPVRFPRVPLTVSYFLARNPASLRAVLAQALLFCTGIIVLFSVLGFVVIDLQVFGVEQLSSSPWVNALIAAVFFRLGLSLLGAFEICGIIDIAKVLAIELLVGIAGMAAKHRPAGVLVFGREDSSSRKAAKLLGSGIVSNLEK